MSDDGSTTVLILGVLAFLSIIALSAYLFLQYSTRELHDDELLERTRGELVNEAEKVMDALLHDPTPEADSRIDPVWVSTDSGDGSPVRVTISDVSSLYGINWVRKDILDHSGLLRFGKTSGDLQQYRWDTGLHLTLSPDFSEFFSDDVLQRCFTAYNFFNINICDEFMIENLYAARGGSDEHARRFRQKLQDYWMGSKPGKPRMIERGDLRGFLGRDFDILFPVVNAEPVMNVHFAPEEILVKLFSFEHHRVPRSAVDFLLANRTAQEWSEEDLERIIGDGYKKTFLHHYLGVTTWFWRIDVRTTAPGRGAAGLRWIVARVPVEDRKKGKIEYRLIEEEFIR